MTDVSDRRERMRMNSARLGNAVRIVVAPDKFKGSLSAGEAAQCLSTGIREARADAEVAVVPMADGGEGTRRGSGGGVGFAALTVLRAERRSGVDVVVDLVRLRDRLVSAPISS